jgi:hypothetical protein
MEKRKRGRPRKSLTDEQVAEVETLAAVLNQAQIAAYLGISERLFAEMVAKQPEITAAYEKGRAKAIGAVAKGLLMRAREGCVASSIFYLKTQARWSETQRHEVKMEGFEVDLVPATKTGE